MFFRRYSCLGFRPTQCVLGLVLWHLLAAVSALGADGLTVGSVLLQANFNTISVRAQYSGDDNGNATVVISFRTGSDAFANSYTPYIDRRGTTGGFANTGWSNEARVKIIGRLPNTAYDVKVDWSDSDGVTGSDPTTNSVTTLSFAATTNGVIRYVDDDAVSEGTGTSGDPWKTITNALAQCNAGDTILVRSGTYVSFTWTKSGTDSAWIVVKPETSGVVIQGGAVAQNITMRASYCVMDNLIFSTAQRRSVHLDSADAHHVFIQNCTMTNVGSLEPSDTTGAAVYFAARTNIYILTNAITYFDSTPAANTHGLYPNSGCSNVVIYSNGITNWADGIGGGGNSKGSGFLLNCDIAGNWAVGCTDDAYELDGDSANLAFWNNRGFSGAGNDFISLAPILTGPAYIFRNIANITNMVVVKLGNNCVGPHYLFHNTFSTTNSSGTTYSIWTESGGDPHSINGVYHNNISMARGTPHDRTGNTNTFNYNCYFKTVSTLVFDWNETTTDYATLADFQAGTTQEDNGLEGDPLIQNYITGEIPSTSIARNAGVSLANFNDSTSPWPAQGSAPDMGIFEFVEQPPLKLTIGGRVNVSGRVTVGQ